VRRDTDPAAEQLTAADGQSIAARFFAPAGESKGAVLIAGAMGVAQDYYAAFARWLRAQGHLAATFDYRGIGYSRPPRLRGFRADVLDWARLDCSAVIDAVNARAPGKPLVWIGHSLGGQILAFVPNRERIAKIVTVACGSGYWRDTTTRLKRRALIMWFVVVPLGTVLFGYFPGKRLRLIGDLPRGVIRQWRRWCLNSSYAAGAEGEWARAAYGSVTTPLVSLSFTDDEFMSARSIDSLNALYRSAPQTLRRIAPAEAGVPRIGHFGFFRESFDSTLWRKYIAPELTG
jgi:predicted alpha/beta hydrolase